MKVQVKRRHIDVGIPNLAAKSPIALAVSEQLGGAVVHESSDGFISIFTGVFRGEVSDYYLPKSAREFTRRFDAGENVKGITFNMTPLQM